MIERRPFGSTGREVSRIGISSSFGAEKEVYQEAFEQGCNYFTWGTFIRGRSSAFRSFMQQIISAGRRDEIFLGLLSYSHSGLLGNHFFYSALRQLGTDYVDGLILGYYPKRPPQRLLDWAMGLKEKGLVRAVGITTHNREMIAPLVKEGSLDFFHFRYNAVHSGAENDIFPHLGAARPGLVSFTATCWGELLKEKKMAPGMRAATPGDCYRFVLARPEIDVCMMGVKNMAMLEENFSALQKGAMTSAEIQEMRAIGAHIYGKPRPI